MSKKEKYKRYGWEDAYDTEIENDWTNRLNLDDCIEIMNNQYNKIEELKQQLAEEDKEIENLKKQLFDKIFIERTKFDEYLEKHLRHEICEKIRNNSQHSIGGYYRVYENTLNGIEKGEE